MSDTIPTTRNGYEKLKAELARLENVEMPAISKRVADARSEGDLSENAEYHGQREAQGLLQARINRLKSKLASSYIVDKAAIPKGIVAFGSLVTVKDVADGIEEKYQFVGPGEEDYSSDVLKILTSSPLAKAMLGKKPGEQVDVPLPKGSRRMEIVSIEEAS